jgi:hypothetical protein
VVIQLRRRLGNLLLGLLQSGRVLGRELTRRRVLALCIFLVRHIGEVGRWQDVPDEN